MNSFFKFTLSAVAFLLLTGAFVETKAQTINEVLRRMEEHNKALTSLRANVKMEKYNSQLDESDFYEGKTIYLVQRGDKPYVRIDWSKPAEESLAVFKGQYIIYRPRLKQVMTGSVDSAKGNSDVSNPLSFINMSKAELKANFSIKYIGEETASGVKTWHLELTPKTGKSFKVADIWVDGNGMPIQMKITEKNNDTTTVVLSNMTKNSTIKGSVFVIDYPKDTQIVKG